MSAWTDDKMKLLATLANDGWSSSQIAEKLHTTRNAIIGKVHRLGLTLKNLVNGKKELPRPSKQRRKRPYDPPAGLSILQSQPEPLVVGPPKIADPNKPIVLMDLTHRSCRWPINEGYPEFYFCGKHCDPGPYCAEHMRKAYSQSKR